MLDFGCRILDFPVFTLRSSVSGKPSDFGKPSVSRLTSYAETRRRDKTPSQAAATSRRDEPLNEIHGQARDEIRPVGV